VLTVPLEVHVLDAGGSPVRVDRRLAVSAPPTWVRLQADPRDRVARAAHRHPSSGHVGGDDGPVWTSPLPVEAWAGPWPIVERWWSWEASRRAFLQLAMRGEDGQTEVALLVALHEGRWMLEAVYD
jgi:protein ImuB